MTMQVARGLRSYATARCNAGESCHAKATAFTSVHYTHTPIYLQIIGVQIRIIKLYSDYIKQKPYLYHTITV